MHSDVQSTSTIKDEYMTNYSMLNQHYNPEKMLDQETAHWQTNSQSEFFLMLDNLDIQHLLYASLYHVCFAVTCLLDVGTNLFPISAKSIGWSYIKHPKLLGYLAIAWDNPTYCILPQSTARQCMPSPHVPSAFPGTLKIPLSIRRLQPCGR